MADSDDKLDALESAIADELIQIAEELSLIQRMLVVKECTKCHKVLPLNAFHAHPKTKDRRQSWCKECKKEYNRSVKVSSEKSAEYNRKALYGITEEEYQSLVVKQHGLCGICSKAKPLVVDHDHNTNDVRGLLCINCNVILGHAKDQVAVLKSAIVYLEQQTGDKR